MKFLGMHEGQWLIIVLGHLCMVELLLFAAPSVPWAVAGGMLWSGISAGLFIRKNLQDTMALVDSE